MKEPVRAELPDGTILEFPAGTDTAIVQAAVKKHLKENPVQMRTPIDEAVSASRSPLDTMGTMDRFMAGAGKSATDFLMGLQQLGGISSTRDFSNKKALDAPLMTSPSAQLGAFGGDVATFLGPGAALRGASALPKLGVLDAVGSSMMVPRTFSQGATAGGVNAALSPVESFGDKPGGILASAGMGGGIAGAPGVLKGVQDPAILRATSEGVTPTVGQMLGGTAKRIEEGLTSVPILGDVIKGAQNRGVESVNAAAFNRALKPVGESLPKGMVGRDAVAYTHEKLSQGYNKLLPQLSAQVDNDLMTAVAQIRQDAQRLPPDKQKQLEAVLRMDLLDRFKPGPSSGGVRPKVADGETLKKIESKLGEFARSRIRSADPDDRDMGYLVSEAQSAVKELILRSNPSKAKELRNLNEGWANFLRVQRAALTQDGVFTPAQLGRAVKGLDPSRNKGQYARGDALMQELADDSVSLMGNVVPDSGTPLRAFAATGMTGLAGGGGYLVNPMTGALAASLPFLYTPAGQRAMVQLATRRPALLQSLGDVTARPMGYVTAPALSARDQ